MLPAHLNLYVITDVDMRVHFVKQFLILEGISFVLIGFDDSQFFGFLRLTEIDTILASS